MQQFNHNEHPHRRYNPLLDEWILVSPHRAKRPWQGQNEKIAEDNRPEHDENCYLCSGNIRSNGIKMIIIPIAMCLKMIFLLC